MDPNEFDRGPGDPDAHCDGRCGPHCECWVAADAPIPGIWGYCSKVDPEVNHAMKYQEF